MSRPVYAVLVTLLATGCFSGQPGHPVPNNLLRIAVTTSTRDSGLLDVLVPVFEDRTGARVDVIAVGTGAAMALGESGDVDVVLAHARDAEDAFMAADHGIRREDVMYNSFEILGPPEDPAGIRDLPARQALQKIADCQHPFVSRGDESGTHKREQTLWAAGSGKPDWDGLVETGQGMGATLTIADQLQAYVLCDHGTYLKFKPRLRLVPLVNSVESLSNPYGIMVVNPQKNPRINRRLADEFVNFMISAGAQSMIRDYRFEGEQLFYPMAIPQD